MEAMATEATQRHSDEATKGERRTIDDAALLDKCHRLRAKKVMHEAAAAEIRELQTEILADFQRLGISRHLTIAPLLRCDRRRASGTSITAGAFVKLCRTLKIAAAKVNACLDVKVKEAKALVGADAFGRVAESVPGAEYIQFQTISNGTVGAAE